MEPPLGELLGDLAREVEVAVRVVVAQEVEGRSPVG